MRAMERPGSQSRISTFLHASCRVQNHKLFNNVPPQYNDPGALRHGHSLSTDTNGVFFSRHKQGFIRTLQATKCGDAAAIHGLNSHRTRATANAAPAPTAATAAAFTTVRTIPPRFLTCSTCSSLEFVLVEVNMISVQQTEVA